MSSEPIGKVSRFRRTIIILIVGAALVAASVVGWLGRVSKASELQTARADLTAARSTLATARAELADVQKKADGCAELLDTLWTYVVDVADQFANAGADSAALIGTSLGFQGGLSDLRKDGRTHAVLALCGVTSS